MLFHYRSYFQYFAILLLLLILSACTGSPQVYDEAPYIESGDLASIVKRGKIRVLIPDRGNSTYLSRDGSVLDQERDVFEEFASQQGLEIIWIQVQNADNLLTSLNDGKGDVVLANLTVTPERKREVAFTVPLVHVREVLVTRAEDNRKIRRIRNLYGRTLVARKSSSYWRTLRQYNSKHPKIRIQAAPEEMNTLDILENVATGKFDTAVVDDNIARQVLAYEPRLRKAFNLTGRRAIAWATRRNSPRLLAAINSFIHKRQLAQTLTPETTGDLQDVRKRGVLRVLTRNDPATYFLWKGEIMGFEYDLMKRFAKQQGVRLEMVVPPTQADLIPWLKQGKGDVIAASLTINDSRRSEDVEFTRPYHMVQEVVVAHTDDNNVQKIDDLGGRTITVHRSSSYWPTLNELRASGINLNLEAAPRTLSVRELLDRIADKTLAYTVVDSHILGTELAWRSDIREVVKLGKPVPHGWIVRKDDKALLKSLNDYIRKEYRSLFYNVTRDKYFNNSRTAVAHLKQRSASTGKISPYDDLIYKYATRYGFDWHLIAAQMYRESRFDPKARSWAGAQGLMQVMPRTAREMGFRKLDTTDTAIHAGIKYMAHLMSRFEETLTVKDRTWFALAAYNAGYGHVSDARRLAKKMNYDHGRWFDNVEKAMLLLSKPEYHRNARHGYVRGSEPVQYVREIRDYYQAYNKRVTRIAASQPTLR